MVVLRRFELSGGLPLIDKPSPPAKPSRAERLERATLVLILLAVATLAGKVAFFRVVDWTMANSPAATPRNAGWTNGVITELLPIGGLLYIRHQKRHGRTPGLLAWSVLGGAFAFSLTAQLAQAKPSVFGWVVAAMPSAAFMVLSKMVVSMRPTQQGSELPALASVGELPVARESAREASRTQEVRPESPAESGPPEPAPLPPIRRSTRGKRGGLPASLTNAGKVAATVKKLGVDTPIAKIASEAGVSVSTARRYLPVGQAAASPSPLDGSPGLVHEVAGSAT